MYRAVIDSLKDLYASQAEIQEFDEFEVQELGVKIVEHSEVLSPRFSYSGIWTALNWNLEEGMSVFDIGCGSGILSVAAAVRSNVACVIATDISSAAIKCTNRSAYANNVEHKIHAVKVDLFGLLDVRVDRIVFNAPFWDNDRSDENPLTWATCDRGREVLKRFLNEAPDHLEHSDSQVILTLSTQDRFSNVEEIIREARGLKVAGQKTETIGHTRVMFFLKKA